MSEFDAQRNSLFPAPVGPHPVDPQHYELIYIYVQDIGHEQEAYYKLGWHCISRHDRFALLCNDSVEQPLKFLIMEMTA